MDSRVAERQRVLLGHFKQVSWVASLQAVALKAGTGLKRPHVFSQTEAVTAAVNRAQVEVCPAATHGCCGGAERHILSWVEHRSCDARGREHAPCALASLQVEGLKLQRYSCVVSSDS